MKSFKTPLGTILPLFQVEKSKKDKITGKWIKQPPQDYLEVKYRLVWFREQNPDWSIETEMIDHSPGTCLFKAKILNEEGRVLATAHKREHAEHFSDYEEKAETSAIGRALAMCGYGTQFAPDITEDDRIVDAPVDSQPPKFDEQEEIPPFDSLPKTKDLKELDNIKFRIGQWAGKPFKDVIKEFPTKVVGYCHWIQGKLDKNEKVSVELLMFLDYAKSKGFDIK